MCRKVPSNGLKNPNEWYSGKKKGYTIKTQVIIERKSERVLEMREGNGSVYDVKLFKERIGKSVNETIRIQAELGYLGIEKHHGNSQIPKKGSTYHMLREGERRYNLRLSRSGVEIEHSNAKIKTCKSMAYPYRNHCRRHLVRMVLISGIINFELPI
ncbi:putative IS5 family transposase IS1515 [Hollandina sp. SP2]